VDYFIRHGPNGFFFKLPDVDVGNVIENDGGRMAQRLLIEELKLKGYDLYRGNLVLVDPKIWKTTIDKNA